MITLVFLFQSAGFFASGQETGTLFFLPGISQTSLENPAFRTDSEKLVFGIPFFSGISGQWNSSVPLNSLFYKGFDYSIHSLYDALDEKGKLQLSAGVTIFYAGFSHNDYSFSFAVSEKAFTEVIFDRDVLLIIRDGTQGYFGTDRDFGKASLFLTHYREIAPGFSKRIWEKLDIGFRPKILFGKLHFAGSDLNISVLNDKEKNNLHLLPKGDFTLSAPIDVKHFPLQKYTRYFLDISPGDYFFQLKNIGVALDFGILYRPDKFSELSFSINDAGFLGFNHKTFGISFSEPLIYTEKEAYQSVNKDAEKYREPREALISFGDSVSFVTEAGPAQTRHFSTLPLKINAAGKYSFSQNITAGFHNQLRYYQLNLINFFSVFGTTAINPRFSLYGSLTLRNTEAVLPGFGCSYTSEKFQIYFTSNNITGIIQPKATKQLNLSFGINYLFSTK